MRKAHREASYPSPVFDRNGGVEWWPRLGLVVATDLREGDGDGARSANAGLEAIFRHVEAQNEDADRRMGRSARVGCEASRPAYEGPGRAALQIVVVADAHGVGDLFSPNVVDDFGGARCVEVARRSPRDDAANTDGVRIGDSSRTRGDAVRGHDVAAFHLFVC